MAPVVGGPRQGPGATESGRSYRRSSNGLGFVDPSACAWLGHDSQQRGWKCEKNKKMGTKSELEYKVSYIGSAWLVELMLYKGSR